MVDIVLWSLIVALVLVNIARARRAVLRSILNEKETNMTETGIKRTDEGVFCESCGNDLTVEGSIKLTMHADGRDFFVNHYQCTKCGAAISLTFERKEKWGF